MKNCDNVCIEYFFADQVVTEGVYVCKNCGQKIYVFQNQKLPKCPKCLSKIWTSA